MQHPQLSLPVVDELSSRHESGPWTRKTSRGHRGTHHDSIDLARLPEAGTLAKGNRPDLSAYGLRDRISFAVVPMHDGPRS